ncbi:MULTISPECIES: TetR/AcrR family transcriptional regulator [unclassified Enterococcus]|uniref:TetR/AcrR family transcriptional regulator n=1 Tax=unclassified Enterococcus TaxID=2608891 RepID=UPI0013EE2FC5|nr:MULTISPECIES: TetR/AcrR family transcriptional regulator [unclassified Enterococcus]
MGRVTNFSKEYLLYKSMVYASEYGMASITARRLANFCGCSTYPFYSHFKSISVLKEKIVEEISECFDRYLAEYKVDDFYSIVYLFNEFFAIHESIYGIIMKSELDMASLFKRTFTEYIKENTEINEKYLLDLLWLNALGSLNSDQNSGDFFEMMSSIWSKIADLEKELPEILKRIEYSSFR